MLTHLKIWKCDGPGCEVEFIEREGEKPPRTWVWFKSGDKTLPGVRHRCPECEAKAPPDQKGLPLGVESVFQRKR